MDAARVHAEKSLHEILSAIVSGVTSNTNSYALVRRVHYTKTTGTYSVELLLLSAAFQVLSDTAIRCSIYSTAANDRLLHRHLIEIPFACVERVIELPRSLRRPHLTVTAVRVLSRHKPSDLYCGKVIAPTFPRIWRPAPVDAHRVRRQLSLDALPAQAAVKSQAYSGGYSPFHRQQLVSPTPEPLVTPTSDCTPQCSQDLPRSSCSQAGGGKTPSAGGSTHKRPSCASPSEGPVKRTATMCAYAGRRNFYGGPQQQQQQQQPPHYQQQSRSTNYSAEDFLSPDLEESPEAHVAAPRQQTRHPSRTFYGDGAPGGASSGSENVNHYVDSNSRAKSMTAHAAQSAQPPPSFGGSGPMRRGGTGGGPPTGYSGVSPRAAPYQRQPAGGGPPIVRRQDPQTIPICKLDKFLTKWAIKGRFVNRGEPRTFKRKTGEGRVWSIDMIDSAHPCGSIRCTFFDEAVDKYYETIQEGQIYRLARARLREKDKRFNQLAHDYEIMVNEDTEITWLAVDDSKIPKQATRQIVKLRNLTKKEKGETVTVLGVVVAKSAPIQIIRRSTGEPTSKCEITIVDDSQTSVEISLWNNRVQWAETVNPEDKPILLAEGCRVEEFNGRRLGSVGQSTFTLNPDSPDALSLGQWWSRTGSNIPLHSFTALSRAEWGDTTASGGGLTVTTIEEMITKLANTGGVRESSSVPALEDKGLYFMLRGTLSEIVRQRPFYYLACPTCRKKVNLPEGAEGDANVDTAAFCDRCNAVVPKPIKQYRMDFRISDATASVTATAMTDAGKSVMGGRSADELHDLQLLGPRAEKTYDDVIEQRCRRDYLFKIRVKSETFRDETRLRYTLVALTPLNGYDNTADVDGPFGLATAARQIQKEAENALQFIYTAIPKLH